MAAGLPDLVKMLIDRGAGAGHFDAENQGNLDFGNREWQYRPIQLAPTERQGQQRRSVVRAGSQANQESAMEAWELCEPAHV